MKKVIKKATTMIMAAGLGISMLCPVTPVLAGQKDQNVVKQAKYQQPEEWNKEEIIAYQFDSTNKYEKYLTTGGNHLYDKNYKSEDKMVKITVADPGYFVVGTDIDVEEGQGKVTLYDSTKKKVLAKTTSDGDLEYARLAKAGEVFYVKLPDKIDKIIIKAGVIKDGFGSMKASDTYYESGRGKSTYHTFSITKRSAVEFNVSAIEKKGGETYAHIDKEENGTWKRLDNTVKIDPNSYDDDFVHGLKAGKYRLVIKAPTSQLNAVSYTKSTRSKNVAYKKSKAKKIKFNGETTNLYTTGESASRWYKISITSTKKRKSLELGKDTVSGGYRFVIYKNGQKKAIKTVKVTGNANAKRVKLPKKKGTYYIKISKLTKKTNGVYEIGYYNY